MDFITELTEVFNKYKIEVSPQQAEKLKKYYELINEWNNKFNLTTILEQRDVIFKHFLDSALVVEGLKADAKIIDIGTGAGLPGVVIKILRPDVEVLLIDGSNKRVTFLNEVIANLELNNITAMHTRCEDLAQKPEYREKFDYSMARAVAELNVLSEYCLPFVKLYGHMVCYKSKNAAQEVESAKAAIEILGGKVAETKNVNIEEIGAERNLLFIQKRFKTPQKYPRGQNKPRLNPL